MTTNDDNTCSNCGIKNPLYEKNCVNCKHYLRTAIINIDLWSTIWKLFESPKKALLNIIYAEHKNFVMILLLLFNIKVLLTSISIKSGINSLSISKYNYLIQLAIFLIITIIFAKITTVFFNKTIKTRFKDNLSIITYSQIPIIFSLFILTPVEYSIFGSHWLFNNPSPFIIKQNSAYILVFIEALMLVWSIYILYTGFKIQSQSKIISIITIGIFVMMYISTILFIPNQII